MFGSDGVSDKNKKSIDGCVSGARVAGKNPRLGTGEYVADAVGESK